MSYRHFLLRCGCGAAPARIEEVGVTDERELVIHWWCEQCQAVVYASRSLADCWRNCPQTPAPALSPPLPQSPDGFDEEFLESIGVRLPE
jgi:hypothetical protein